MSNEYRDALKRLVKSRYGEKVPGAENHSVGSDKHKILKAFGRLEELEEEVKDD